MGVSTDKTDVSDYSDMHENINFKILKWKEALGPPLKMSGNEQADGTVHGAQECLLKEGGKQCKREEEHGSNSLYYYSALKGEEL